MQIIDNKTASPAYMPKLSWAFISNPVVRRVQHVTVSLWFQIKYRYLGVGLEKGLLPWWQQRKLSDGIQIS